MIKNKNILITGASSGIGADLLKMLAPFNKVIAVARNIDKIYKHENVKPMVCDISKVENIDMLFDYVYKELGDIDIVFANAGFAYYERIKEANWENIDSIFKTNVYSSIYMATKLKQLKGEESFKIVITASAMSFHAVPGYSLYAATKFALRGFADAYGYELSKGQHIQLVCPVATITNFFEVAGAADIPWPSQKSETVAKKIIRGAKTRKRYIHPSFIFRFALFLNRFLPALRIFNKIEEKKFNKKFPKHSS